MARTAGSWQPGQSGNPKGRVRGGETVVEALRAALTLEARTAIAERVVSMAMAGDLGAVQLLINRLDPAPPAGGLTAQVLTMIQVTMPDAQTLALAGPEIESDAD